MRHALGWGHLDIVLTDYALPRFSGLDALGLLRKMGSQIPALGITGNADPKITEQMLEAGAHACISKNDLSTLCDAVEDALSASSSPHATQDLIEQKEAQRAQAGLEMPSSAGAETRSAGPSPPASRTTSTTSSRSSSPTRNSLRNSLARKPTNPNRHVVILKKFARRANTRKVSCNNSSLSAGNESSSASPSACNRSCRPSGSCGPHCPPPSKSRRRSTTTLRSFWRTRHKFTR